MEPIRVHTGVVVGLDRSDVDTDQIIPKQFLKRVERTGYGEFLFHDWRTGPDGEPDPGFPLNRPGLEDATILVVGSNFGCGSSREHAAWALRDYGFRVVLAPSFADIFRENADQNGLAAIELPESSIARLLERASRDVGYSVTVDLERCRVSDGDTIDQAFEIDDFRRIALMEGLDRIARTLRHANEIDDFERRRHDIRFQAEDAHSARDGTRASATPDSPR